MELSDNDKLYIKNNFKKISSRQLAKKIGCPRPVIEKYIESLSPTSEYRNTRFVSKIPPAYLILFLFFLTFLSYSNSLGFDFVWDDTVQISNDPFIKDFTIKGLQTIFKIPVGVIGESNSYRPFQTLTYMITYHFFSLNPVFYHLTNILLQCVASILLFFLIFRLLDDKETAFWVSSLFSIHPVQIAAVTYIAGRAESLAIIFMLSSFYFFHRSLASDGLKSFIFSIVSTFFLCVSLFTKELFLVSPLLFFVYFMIYSKQKKLVLRWFYFLNYGIGTAFYFIVRMKVLGHLGQGMIGDLSVHHRIIAMFLVMPYYLKLLIFPNHLHMAYQFQAQYLNFSNPIVILGMSLVVFFAILTWLNRNSKKILFGCVWFFIFLSPLLNIFVLVNGAMAEHWLYNASIGFFIVMVSLLLEQVSKKYFVKNCVEPFLAVILFAFAITTYHSNKVWKDEITLYKNVLKYVHHDPDIYNNLGVAYIKKRMFKEAEQNFKQALKIDPSSERASRNLKVLGQQKLTEGIHDG